MPFHITIRSVSVSERGRLRKLYFPECSLILLTELDTLLRNINFYDLTFKTLREIKEQERLRCIGSQDVAVNYSIMVAKETV